jgi:hypothetical protein
MKMDFRSERDAVGHDHRAADRQIDGEDSDEMVRDAGLELGTSDRAGMIGLSNCDLLRLSGLGRVGCFQHLARPPGGQA